MCNKEKNDNYQLEMLEKEINALLVDDSAKEMLMKVATLATSKVEEVKSLVPSLIIEADDGAGVTSYCKAYSSIVDECGLYRVRGTATYLDLTFPPITARPETVKRFFASPSIAASITNRFYGTFVISFTEWSGMDLIRDESFMDLLEFIERNSDNISFCFHVNPNFTAKDELKNTIAKRINLMEVTLLPPNEERAFEYMMNNFKKAGYSMEENAVEKLREEMIPETVHRTDYAGYRTLDMVLRRIYYEMAMSGNLESFCVDKNIIEKVKGDYGQEKVSTCSFFGFK